MDIPGYRIGGPIGFGTGGAVLLGRDRTGRAVAVRLLEAAGGAEHSARLAALQQVRHHHLAAVLDVVDRGGGAAAVVSEAIVGPTVDTVRAARGGLSAAEAFGVGSQIAAALQALHERGITHGDVSPANIVICPRGGSSVAVLVDLAGDVSSEAGTPGFAAPERIQGTPPDPAADVYALARLLCWAVTPAAQDQVRTQLQRALLADPRRRCTLAELAAVAADRPKAPIKVPQSHLAATSVREHAHREATIARSDRGPRHRAPPSRTPLVVAVSIGVALLAGAGVWQWPIIAAEDPGATPASPLVAGTGDPARNVTSAEPADAGVTAAPEQFSDPIDAARRLTQQRDDAIAAGDGAALTDVTVPGSPAAAQDESLIESLDSGALRVIGLHTRIDDLQLVNSSPTTEPDGETHDAAVRATMVISAHELRGADGSVAVPRQRSCAVLVLSGTDSLRVADVREC